MPEYVEMPGVRAPCGHIHPRPDPAPVSFKIECHCGAHWKFVAEAGGLTWKAYPLS